MKVSTTGPGASVLPVPAGVNISGLEGVCAFRHAMHILLQPGTYNNIREHGFDSMRVAIDFRNFYEAGTQSLIEKRMEKIDRALDLAEQAGLYDLADPADTDLYLRTLLGFCKKNSLPWAAWNY
ncbi:MAG: hypothetical protein IJF67_14540, partial [Clostridia bacterium]|nr:hypothetical protein [Clostridia bacterium]